jgi:hypothetical protein
VRFWLLIFGSILLTWIVVAKHVNAQPVSAWAYTLEDQAEPEYLALRTQYGTLRVIKGDDWACGYLLANQNVQIIELDAQTVLMVPEGEGWVPSCSAQIVGQVDEQPCFMNANRDCDVRVENE